MNYNLIISFILLLLIILKIYNKIDVTIHTIIIITVITVLLLLKMNSKENFTPQEVLQNLGSLYNDQNMTVTNLTVTGKLTVGDPLTNTVKMTINDSTNQAGNLMQLNSDIAFINNKGFLSDITLKNLNGTINAANCNMTGITNLGTANISGSANISGKTTTQNLDVSGLAQQISPAPTGTTLAPGKSFLKDGDTLKFVLNGQSYPTDGQWGVGDNWEIGFKGNHRGISESLILLDPKNRDTTDAAPYWSPKFRAQKV
jgi:hypothetical protein